jgi:hypothetical protein
MFSLCAHPEYMPILREEMDSIGGWDDMTKVDMAKLVKMDSFVKESQRFAGITGSKFAYFIALLGR